MKVSLLQNKRIIADIKGKTIITDQSCESNGLGVYSSPFDIFKASLGCCMGYYVMSFCVKNDIPLDSVSLEIDFKEEKVIKNVNIKILVDARFPSKYYKAVIKSAEACKVKKQISAPPSFNLNVETIG